MKGRTIRAAAALAASVLLLAGCSANPKQGGKEITNAKEALEQAKTQFQLVAAQAKPMFTTIADEPNCFFEKSGEGSEVTEMIYCGPIKNVGEEGNWLRVGSAGSTSDGKVSLSGFKPVDFANPSGELFRPDGIKPMDVAELKDPPGPEATVKDFTAIVPLDRVPSVEL